jgi:amidohydrolase
MNSDGLIERELPRYVDLRHRLHRIPELGYEEFKTAAMLRAELDRIGIQHIDGVRGAETATVALIGDSTKPCIALRADIDALPIVERTGLPYASTHEGRMHACGHDGHASTLMGAAAVLHAMRDTLPVCVKLLFQPAEEGGAGAKQMVDAGVLDGRVGPKVEAIFGMHGWPSLPVGLVSTRPGALLAATDGFAATFVGRGCHGAYPHLGHDPIVAASEAVVSLQSVVSREVDPTDSCVVTVGVMRGGTATNVIPDEATIEATVRTLKPETRTRAQVAIRRRLDGIAAAHGCTLRYEWIDGYPATINDPAMADYVARIARQTLGQDRFLPASGPSMGGEDFAFFLNEVKGCFFLVGIAPPGSTSYPPLHNDRFDFTDAAMATGMRMFVELVRNYAA